MASAWTDESAIVRDLSVAQGRWVPGGIDSTVAGGKPPTLNIAEETEEEYFRRWTGDGDFSAGPDLFRIKKMLELMQNQEAPDEDIPTGPIEITKLNRGAGPKGMPQLNLKALSFVPKLKARIKENRDPAPNKPRRARNVAIASIMALTNETNPIEIQEPLKLCKPEDFMKSNPEDEIERSERRKDSLNKVTNWLQSQDMPSMFKKKSSVHSSKNGQSISNFIDFGAVSLFKSPVKSNLDDSVKSKSDSSVRSPGNEQYIPSSWAEEYYKKAVDRSLMRDLVRDDVWGRAERVMKKIDEHKAEKLRIQQEAAKLAAATEADATTDNHQISEDTAAKVPTDNSEGIAHVVLAKHRHELIPGRCVVCEVLTASRPAKTEPSFAGPSDVVTKPTKIQSEVTPNFAEILPETVSKSGTKSHPEVKSKFTEILPESVAKPDTNIHPESVTEPTKIQSKATSNFTEIMPESVAKPDTKVHPESVTEPSSIDTELSIKPSFEEALPLFSNIDTELSIKPSFEEALPLNKRNLKKTPLFSKPNLDTTKPIELESTKPRLYKAEIESVTKPKVSPRAPLFEELLKCFDDEETCEPADLSNETEKESQVVEKDYVCLMRMAVVENLNELDAELECVNLFSL